MCGCVCLCVVTPVYKSRVISPLNINVFFPTSERAREGDRERERKSEREREREKGRERERVCVRERYCEMMSSH